jgi:hypothetical protein
VLYLVTHPISNDRDLMSRLQAMLRLEGKLGHFVHECM